MRTLPFEPRSSRFARLCAFLGFADEVTGPRPHGRKTAPRRKRPAMTAAKVTAWRKLVLAAFDWERKAGARRRKQFLQNWKRLASVRASHLRSKHTVPA